MHDLLHNKLWETFYHMAAFKAPHHWTSVQGWGHTHCTKYQHIYMVYCVWKPYKHFTVIKYTCKLTHVLGQAQEEYISEFFGHCNFIYTNLSSRMLSWALILRTRSRNSMSYNVPRTHLVLPLQQGHALPCPQRRTRYVRNKKLGRCSSYERVNIFRIIDGLVVESLEYSQRSDGSEPAFP